MSYASSSRPPIAALPLRSEFDEDGYLQINPDVAAAVAAGVVGSGWQHFTLHGFREGRSWVPKGDPLAGVSREIAPGDGMYRQNAEHYFDAGASALQVIEAALFAARRPASSVSAILDLPCGHGRVMRFLRKAFPRARLTACDLQRDGVEFCARTFAATPVLSSERPDDILLPEPYDLIWCGSLLTHLSEGTCGEFFARFHAALRPHGLLVVTLHGRLTERELESGRHRYGLAEAEGAAVLKRYRESGFGYVDYEPGSGYGISLARPSYILRRFAENPGWRIISYQEHGWDGRQDVLCLQRTAD